MYRKPIFLIIGIIVVATTLCGCQSLSPEQRQELREKIINLIKSKGQLLADSSNTQPAATTQP